MPPMLHGDVPSPMQAEYLEEMLWTIPEVESVQAFYDSPSTEDETRAEHWRGVGIILRCGREAADAAVSSVLDKLGSDVIPAPLLAALMRHRQSRALQDADWAEVWKQFWGVTRITDRLVICPSWEKAHYTPKPGEWVIQLDPENVFGTGTHDTTQLMLQRLEALADQEDFSQKSILDVGMGSGILGIYAAMRGCRMVRGIDIEPAAVHTAADNATRNGVADRTDFSDTPLDALCRTKYDLILANIIAPVILELLPDICRRLAIGGQLYLSGLVAQSVGPMGERLLEEGFTDIERYQQGDWYALSSVYAGA